MYTLKDIYKDLSAVSKRKIKPETETKFIEKLLSLSKEGYKGNRLDGMLANSLQNLSNVQIAMLYIKHEIPDMENSFSMKKAMTALKASKVDNSEVDLAIKNLYYFVDSNGKSLATKYNVNSVKDLELAFRLFGKDSPEYRVKWSEVYNKYTMVRLRKAFQALLKDKRLKK